MSAEAFDVDVGGRRLRVEVTDCSYADVSHALVGVPAQLLFRVSLSVDADGVAVTPQAWKGHPTPDPLVVEYVAGAIRERAAAWGPPALWSDSDWRSAFACAMSGLAGVENYAGSIDRFDIADVADVIALVDGENDEASWCAALRLRDGRFAYVEAWCDYTGWG